MGRPDGDEPARVFFPAQGFQKPASDEAAHRMADEDETGAGVTTRLPPRVKRWQQFGFDALAVVAIGKSPVVRETNQVPGRAGRRLANVKLPFQEMQKAFITVGTEQLADDVGDRHQPWCRHPVARVPVPNAIRQA